MVDVIRVVQATLSALWFVDNRSITQSPQNKQYKQELYRAGTKQTMLLLLA